MSRYSINGYVIALRNRSTHTICTEGKDDSIAVKHCLLDFLNPKELVNQKYVIDTMEIIESDGVTYGNKDKLLKIHECIVGTPTANNVSMFADREYSYFDINNIEIDSKPIHIKESDILWYTRGHSIENYLFEPNFYIKYLEFNHPDQLLGNYKNLINDNWQNILDSSASLTYSIHEHNLCTKSKGLFCYNDWQMVSADKIVINTNSVKLQLLTRGIPQNKVDSILSRAAALQPILSKKTVTKWIIHGHIGLDLLCGAIGCVLLSLGTSEHICNAIGGNCTVKFKYLVSQWYLNSTAKPEEFPIKLFQRIENAVLS